MILPEYTIYRSTKKNIRLVLHPDGTLAVYCPKRCSKSRIEETIQKLYPKMKKRHEARGDALFGKDGTLPYLGKRYPIIYNNVKKLTFDGEKFICPMTDREAVREMYRELLRNEAKRLIPPMVAQVAGQFNFGYNKVSIKSAYSRYGSCSAKKNLNFTLALAAFSIDFMHAVVCHELCHTVHMDHSKNFHALLNSICPRHDALHDENRSERSAILKAIFFNPAS